MRIQCEKELGKWTIRINGHFIADFWRSSKALDAYSRLLKATQKENDD